MGAHDTCVETVLIERGNQGADQEDQVFLLQLPDKGSDGRVRLLDAMPSSEYQRRLEAAQLTGEIALMFGGRIPESLRRGEQMAYAAYLGSGVLDLEQLYNLNEESRIAYENPARWLPVVREYAAAS